MKLEFCCLMTFSNGNQLSNRKFDTFPLDWSHLLTQLWNGREGFKLHLKKGRGWQCMLSLISKSTGCFSSLQVPTRVTAETFRCGPFLTSALLSLVCWPFCLINNCSHPFWSGFLTNPEVLLYFIENWSGPEQQPLGWVGALICPAVIKFHFLVLVPKQWKKISSWDLPEVLLFFPYNIFSCKIY